MEPRTIESKRLTGEKSRTSSKKMERMKCSKTMNTVAITRFVIEVINSLLLDESNCFKVELLWSLQYFVVKMNVVINVVKLNNVLEIVLRIHARLPNSNLNILLPVLKTS